MKKPKPPRIRQPYPSDVSDEEWSFVVPYLSLIRLDSEQREHDLLAVCNALRWLVRSGAHWRMMPHDFPPWAAVYQQMRRWLQAGCFEATVHDLRVLLREHAGREGQPSAMVLDSRTLQSTPESGARAGYDGAKRRKGSKVHAAVDTLGHLLALHVTPADEQDRAQVEELAQAVQEPTDHVAVLIFHHAATKRYASSRRICFAEIAMKTSCQIRSPYERPEIQCQCGFPANQTLKFTHTDS